MSPIGNYVSPVYWNWCNCSVDVDSGVDSGCGCGEAAGGVRDISGEGHTHSVVLRSPHTPLSRVVSSVISSSNVRALLSSIFQTIKTCIIYYQQCHKYNIKWKASLWKLLNSYAQRHSMNVWIFLDKTKILLVWILGYREINDQVFDIWER